MKSKTFCTWILSAILLSLAGAASAESWDSWWDGKFGNSGQQKTCYGTDGSENGPKFYATANGDEAGRAAYSQTLDWVNVANRNPAYIEVFCQN